MNVAECSSSFLYFPSLTATFGNVPECLAGASYAGFYYICLHRKTGKLEGYYFHPGSELFVPATETF